MDTAHTFKLGIFPFTNDPANRNGNGVNGPCWARDADNHQGFSTGPLAGTVEGGPNAPGVQVVSTATWVGTNDATAPRAYQGGGYNLEVKIPASVLPAAIDPNRVGLNITPYDNDDNTAGTGSTILRHVDRAPGSRGRRSAACSPIRTAGAAPSLPGYTPPAGQPTTPAAPKLARPLDSAASPQTIAQSARNGVPIAGRDPAPAARGLSVGGAVLTSSALKLDLVAGAAGTARVFLYDVRPQDGNKSYTRVWETSCAPATNPAPDYGLSACAAADGTTPPWAPDMMGAIVREATVGVHGARQPARSLCRWTRRPRAGSRAAPPRWCPGSTRPARRRPSTCGSRPPAGRCRARCRRRSRWSWARRRRSARSHRAWRATTSRSTSATVISTAADATLSVADPSSNATGRLVNGSFSLAQPLQAGTFGNYAAVGGSSNPTAIHSYAGPVSNDQVTIGFKQSIGANEGLRTGTYSKTLTFTLSTTNP